MVQNIEAVLKEYCALRDEKKTIDARMKVLSDTIKKYAVASGSKDDKGSHFCESDGFVFGSQAKTSVKFDEDKALVFFKSHGFFDCIATKEIINEDAVESRISCGDISSSDLESIITTSTTYSVSVKEKEALPVVEQSNISLAASKKPKKLVRGVSVK